MASETEAQVKFTADVKNLLTGMKDSQGAVTAATEGMKGDLGGAIEAFEKLGLAAVAVGAAMLAFEGLKEGFSWVKEAAEHTNELSRSFEGLEFQTGATIHELNEWKVAMQMSGGNIEEMQGWVAGLTRVMATNSEMYVANGIAKDKAALMAMGPIEVIKRTLEVLEAETDVTKRNILAKEMLGRGAAAQIPQIRRFIESLEDAKKVNDQLGDAITADSQKATKEFEKAMGAIDAQLDRTKSKSQEVGNGFALMWKGITAGWTNFIASLASQENDLGYAVGTAMGGEGDQAPKAAEPEKHEAKAPAKKAMTKEEIDQARAIAVEKAQEAVKAKEFEVSQINKADQELYRNGQMLFEDMIEDEKRGLGEIEQARQKADRAELAAMAGKPVEQLKIRDRMLDDHRKYVAGLAELDSKTANHAFDLEKTLTEQCAALNEEYLKKKARQEDAAAEMQAKFELQKDMDVYKSRMALMGTLSSGWDQTIQKMMNGTLSWKDGLHTALLQAGQNFEQLVIKMGMQWAMHELAKTAASEASGAVRVATEEEAALKSVAIWLWAGLKNIAIKAWEAAAAAFASIAAIPVVGPALAPLAAAGALAAVIGIGSHLASAEGGWDRVPSDQVAMIHKNEMVLPAPLAESVRNMASGGGGGGGQAIHIHAMDAQSFNHALKNNIGGLRDVLHQAVRNGRIG